MVAWGKNCEPQRGIRSPRLSNSNSLDRDTVNHCLKIDLSRWIETLCHFCRYRFKNILVAPVLATFEFTTFYELIR